MSKELIERLREAAAQRVASTAMIGADDLIAAADALESMEAAYTSAMEACKALTKQAFKAEQERDALARELTDADIALCIASADKSFAQERISGKPVLGVWSKHLARAIEHYLKGEGE